MGGGGRRRTFIVGLCGRKEGRSVEIIVPFGSFSRKNDNGGGGGQYGSGGLGKDKENDGGTRRDVYCNVVYNTRILRGEQKGLWCGGEGKKKKGAKTRRKTTAGTRTPRNVFRDNNRAPEQLTIYVRINITARLFVCFASRKFRPRENGGIPRKQEL